MRQLTFPPTFAGWRVAARRALQHGWSPVEAVWEELQAGQPLLPLFDEGEPAHEEEMGCVAETPELPELPAPRVPREFFPMAQRVACHRSPLRWALLYAELWRLTHGERHLLEVATDPTVHTLQGMDKAVRHDVHKMRAFVRFRAVAHAGATWYVAWFEPEHHIVELNAPFFRDRFAGMCWSILTPERCAHWDGTALTFTGGVAKSEAPTEDAVEGLWLNYYAHIFNPARVKTHAMQAEMPKKYWKNLPEAVVIPTLLAEAPRRVEQMVAQSRAATRAVPTHAAKIPEGASGEELRAAAAKCRACPLYARATQTVFGEGPEDAKIVFVGEQPGDNEDVEGRPFIGPAGKLFDRALGEAGIDRAKVYVTNAVKHFKWEPRGKRRLHAKPNSGEMAACRPWLAAELALIRPRVLVLLGGTAAQSVMGPQMRVLRDRGKLMESDYCERTLITVHPSSLLRAPDEAARETGFAEFVRDLRVAKRAAGKA